MAETVLENLTEEQLENIVTWLNANYEEIVAACEEKRLPKPPQW